MTSYWRRISLRACTFAALFCALPAPASAIRAPVAEKQSDTAPPAVTPQYIASEVARAQTYFVLLYTLGPTPRTDQEHVAATQRTHLEYLFKLRRAGLLTAQGPILEGGELRGIGFLGGVDEGRARQLAADDPHVKAGYLKAHVFRWMGLPGDRLPPAADADVQDAATAVPAEPEGPRVTPEFIASEIARAQIYVLRLYTLGPTPRTNDEHVAATQQEHLEYLFNLRREGLLTLAGPVLDRPVLEIGELRGIGFLLGVDEENARALAAEDPHVKAGYLKAHVFRWMGLPGDGLPEVGDKKLQSRP